MNIFLNSNEYYETIFQRRSGRKYSAESPMTRENAEHILDVCRSLVPLVSDIPTRFELAERGSLPVKFGHFCILMYSKKTDNCYINAGYMLQQLDLYMQNLGIGVCWYGMASPKEKVGADGLEFMIMLTFGTPDGDMRRKSEVEFSRKPLTQIWSGDTISGVSEAVRLSPSACNSQPWMFTADGARVTVSRNVRIKTIIPRAFRKRFNSIDVGIAMCIFELALSNQGVRFERELFSEGAEADENGLIRIALYKLEKEI